MERYKKFFLYIVYSLQVLLGVISGAYLCFTCYLYETQKIDIVPFFLLTSLITLNIPIGLLNLFYIKKGKQKV